VSDRELAILNTLFDKGAISNRQYYKARSDMKLGLYTGEHLRYHGNNAYQTFDCVNGVIARCQYQQNHIYRTTQTAKETAMTDRITNRITVLTSNLEANSRELDYFSSLPEEPQPEPDGSPTVILVQYQREMGTRRDDGKADNFYRTLIGSQGSESSPLPTPSWTVLDGNGRVLDCGRWDNLVTNYLYMPKHRTTWWLATDYNNVFDHPPVESE